MGVVERASGTVEPDYFQFYARRSHAEWRSDQVSDEGYRDRLWANDGFVYVACCRKFGTTRVDVEVLDEEPAAPDAVWQHVGEVSLPPGDGIAFEVLDWGGDQPVLSVPVDAGPLRARVSWQGLVPGRFEGLDEDGTSDERLLIQLWSAPVTPSTVVRRWIQWEQR